MMRDFKFSLFLPWNILEERSTAGSSRGYLPHSALAWLNAREELGHDIPAVLPALFQRLVQEC